ncbi:hypothetical protein XPA_010379 [Xanthoria parietina]
MVAIDLTTPDGNKDFLDVLKTVCPNNLRGETCRQGQCTCFQTCRRFNQGVHKCFNNTESSMLGKSIYRLLWWGEIDHMTLYTPTFPRLLDQEQPTSCIYRLVTRGRDGKPGR